MKVSVIIVNYNVRYFLEQTLESVEKAIDRMQKEKPGWYGDIWVVDNNSVDSSCEMVRNKFPNVNLIENKDNKGFSKANNQAVRKSDGNYVLLLNPDTVIEENTFVKTLTFMDEHPDAGGLGVKMVDGRGGFLPESKRGFPSPGVAFSKIFGLSKLFPNSERFNYYHLGHLSKEETHKIDVLSGAFMLLRREALDKSGLLDETYFMYGEDIDLSWRIKQAGYENYYYPEVKIIHYKGESTKKSSVNYVFTFYRAMIIFARTHLSKSQARLFTVLIHMAIYLRAGISIIEQFVKRTALPVLDISILFAALYALKVYWENTIKYVAGGPTYPPELLYVNFPAYIVLWILGLLLYRGYSSPFRLWNVVKGVFWGTIMIAVFYAFIPEDYRFSRALIVLGAGAAIIVFSLNRILVHFLKERNLDLLKESNKRLILVGTPEEKSNSLNLLKDTSLKFNFIGYVNPDKNVTKYDDPDYLGNFEQLNELVSIYNAEEIVFSSKNLSASSIIDQMTSLPSDVNTKIIPSESKFAIGSSSKNHPGDLYAMKIDYRINDKDNKLKKRSLDIGISVAILIFSPLLIWFFSNKTAYFRNSWFVLRGKRSWVGPQNKEFEQLHFPSDLKAGILSPAEHLKNGNINKHTLSRLSFLYAKDYKPEKDIKLILKNFKSIDNISIPD